MELEKENSDQIGITIEADDDVENWTVEQVCHYLRNNNCQAFCEAFKREKISGKVFLNLDLKLLKDIGITTLGERMQIMDIVSKCKLPVCKFQKGNAGKIIQDPIHGPIRLHPLCLLIIDTPEFQRLRYLKQLGCAYFVYPSATHSRFEHSIGVYYLAQRLIQELNIKLKDSSEKEISEEDALCVSIAGLCHDLGHGPFSHMWERFVEAARPGTKWKHEDMSVKIFLHIWKKLDVKIKAKFKLNDSHRDLIAALISGKQIVANKVTAIDVDKWDYILRDSYYLGMRVSFDYQRLLQFMRVINVDGKKIICFKDSEIISLHQLFQMRWMLHRLAYKHRVSRIVEKMLIEAFLAADGDLLISGTKCDRKLSGAIDDVEAFLKLNDSVYHRISSELDASHPAHELVNRIECRNLYSSIDMVLLPNSIQLSPSEIEAEIADEGQLKSSSFYVDLVNFDYGMQDKDPFQHIMFYEKSNKDESFRVDRDLISKMLPQEFEEVKLHFISRESGEMNGNMKEAFKTWLRKYNLNSQ